MLQHRPLRVELLTNRVSGGDRKGVLAGLADGGVDIVIGTHALIQEAVDFADLGVVVVDEQHRFGVEQRAALRAKSASGAVPDMLVMTATPIPRTLNLALVGVRDMSVINTAPNDRLPVHTCIETFDEQLIAEAINRELARDGQVFFVHNRVQTIEGTAQLIKQLLPNVRVAWAHGQMKEHELAQAMLEFVGGMADVLVCTSIIESGLDIQNAIAYP